MTDARALIDKLDLRPHPEGGWYRETVREPAVSGERDAVTAILFLLEQGGRSHWHRIDAAELWLWHAGAPLELLTYRAAAIERVLLGGDVLVGERPQALVPRGAWQAAETPHGWALVSCVVVPGFRFDGFELAPPGWSPPVSA